MKRFVVFECQSYMDMYPYKSTNIVEADTLDAIYDKAKEIAYNMSHSAWSGTQTFKYVMSLNQAFDYVLENFRFLNQRFSPKDSHDDKMKLLDQYLDCYINN